jgi:hypothetical protein
LILRKSKSNHEVNELRSAVFNIKDDLLAAAGLEGLLKIWDVSDTIQPV